MRSAARALHANAQQRASRHRAAGQRGLEVGAAEAAARSWPPRDPVPACCCLRCRRRPPRPPAACWEPLPPLPRCLRWCCRPGPGPSVAAPGPSAGARWPLRTRCLPPPWPAGRAPRCLGGRAGWGGQSRGGPRGLRAAGCRGTLPGALRSPASRPRTDLQPLLRQRAKQVQGVGQRLRALALRHRQPAGSGGWGQGARWRLSGKLRGHAVPPARACDCHYCPQEPQRWPHRGSSGCWPDAPP